MIESPGVDALSLTGWRLFTCDCASWILSRFEVIFPNDLNLRKVLIQSREDIIYGKDNSIEFEEIQGFCVGEINEHNSYDELTRAVWNTQTMQFPPHYGDKDDFPYGTHWCLYWIDEIVRQDNSFENTDLYHKTLLDFYLEKTKAETDAEVNHNSILYPKRRIWI